MSTKATILCAGAFHIYRDCNDPGFIYIADCDGNEIKLSEKSENDMGILEFFKRAFLLADKYSQQQSK